MHILTVRIRMRRLRRTLIHIIKNHKTNITNDNSNMIENNNIEKENKKKKKKKKNTNNTGNSKTHDSTNNNKKKKKQKKNKEQQDHSKQIRRGIRRMTMKKNTHRRIHILINRRTRRTQRKIRRQRGMKRTMIITTSIIV